MPNLLYYFRKQGNKQLSFARALSNIKQLACGATSYGANLYLCNTASRLCNIRLQLKVLGLLHLEEPLSVLHQMTLQWSKMDPCPIALHTRLSCRVAKILPDMEFVVNKMDEPRVLLGETLDLEERLASRECTNASTEFKRFRHMHGYLNTRYCTHLCSCMPVAVDFPFIRDGH